MAVSTKVGKDTSLKNGGSLFQTFRDLLKQREALDRQILILQGGFIHMMDEKDMKHGITPSSTRKTYVARMRNRTILKDAIRQCMTPGQKMGMQDILEALQQNGAYNTRSGYFYTMVNNKLNRDPRVKKVARGVFVLHLKPGRKAMTL